MSLDPNEPPSENPFSMAAQPTEVESNQRRREALAAHWADPAKRAAQGDLVRRRMNPAAVRERISERTKAAHDVPGMRERKLAGLTRAFADPELRRRISAATKVGIAAKAEREFAALKGAWDSAPASVRRRFLAETARAAMVGSTDNPGPN